MPLESDVQNADANLHVEFYEREEKYVDHNELPQKRNRTFVRIAVPGDKTQMYDQPMNEDHKLRFPRHWLAYQMQKEGAPAFGTPLADWSADDPVNFNSNQLAEMLALRFQTVEQVAQMADAQLQRVGLGAEGLRERARQYLAGKNKSQEAKELAETKAEMAELRAQMAEMLASLRSPVADDGGGDPDGMTPAQIRMAKARAARKVNVGGEQHASAVGAASHG